MPLMLEEARARAAAVTVTDYTVDLDLTDRRRFVSTTRVAFSLREEAGGTTFLELADAEDVEVEGAAWEYVDDRIVLRDLGATNVVTVTARLPYVTDGDGMHTVTDPADGAIYVSAYTSMDITHRVFACFDQPDLKAPISLRVIAPATWTVLANGALESVVAAEAHRLWTFAPTPPISTYLFTVCCGPWVSREWHYEGLAFAWHARASQAAALDRDFAALQTITEQYFDHYRAVFDEPYVFDSYDQVFGPGLNWGAMEFPGCVVFRDEYLYRDTPTAIQDVARSAVIAHEMAHMWFGNLVTMRWWEDSWLNESFADFMGYSVSALAAGTPDSWIGLTLIRKPTAYDADRKRSTHPVAEDADKVPDVDTAFSNFDMITYAKGSAVVRQLGTWLGEDDFYAGVNAHFAAHRFGNADLDDFLGALDAASERDVRAWAQAWLRTTGFDTIRVERESLADVPVLVRDGSRPHRFTVTAYDESLAVVAARIVDLGEEPLPLPEFAGLVVVPNSADETYAALGLDAPGWAVLRERLGAIDDPHTRAVVWATALADADLGRLPLEGLLDLAERHLADERHPAIFEGVVRRMLATLRWRGAPDTIGAALARLAALATQVLAGPDQARVMAASRLLAQTGAAAPLRDWLAGAGTLPAPQQDVRWLIVQRLAALGDDTFIAAEAARDLSVQGELAAVTARSAIPTPEAKAEAFGRLMSGALGNREFVAVAAGLWGWEQADLVEPYLAAYVREGLALGRRSGQAFGDLIGDAFPWLPLTGEQRRTLRAALAAALADDVPTVLRRAWDDALDDLDLVLGIDGR